MPILPFWILIAIIVILVTVISLILLYRCIKRDTREEEVDEESPLLKGHVRRSSTYYQWNRSPPSKHSSIHEEADSSSTPSTAVTNWEDRRKALLKKYERKE